MNDLIKVDYGVPVPQSLKYFHYSQNNSGGVFTIDDRVTVNVFVQARSYEEANQIAETVGIYFGGFGDCPCCGDRWSAAWSFDEGTDAPEIYGQSIEESVKGSIRTMWVNPGEPYAHVYHYDGTKTSYILPERDRLEAS